MKNETFRAKLNMKPRGAISPTRKTIQGTEILLLATPRGKCKPRLYSQCSFFGWTNSNRVNIFCNKVD